MSKTVLVVAGLLFSVSGFAQSIAGSFTDKDGIAVVTPLEDGRFAIWNSSYGNGVVRDTTDTFPSNFVPAKKYYRTPAGYNYEPKVTKIVVSGVGTTTISQWGNDFYITVEYDY